VLFYRGRKFHGAIFTLHQIILKRKALSLAVCVSFVDYEKVYDSLNLGEKK
jgi:hypothetical protein